MTPEDTPSVSQNVSPSATDPLPSAAEEPAAKGTDVFADVQRQYLPAILTEIRAMALKRAETENRSEVSYRDAFRAFEEKFGHVPPVQQTASSFWKENSFVVIMATMTIIFGVLGLAPMWFKGEGKIAYDAAQFLDIAKLFAGVIVGGAAGAAVATNRRNKA
jgi:hypothetical protein